MTEGHSSDSSSSVSEDFRGGQKSHSDSIPGERVIRPDREAEVRERFEGDTRDHRMYVYRDDGLYRHLRFRARSWSYGYDIVTWPGYLAITGDVGDYVFARVADMFDFFRSDNGRINPQYWAEKIPNRDASAGTRRFEASNVRPRIMEWFEDLREGLDDDEAGSLLAALEEQVFSWGTDDPHAVMHQLVEFEHNGTRIYEPWDFDFGEWDWTYLWSCWAIVQGIAQYDWTKGWRADAST